MRDTLLLILAVASILAFGIYQAKHPGGAEKTYNGVEIRHE